MNEAAARAALIAGGERLGARRLIVAAEGNLSIRLGGGAILITPSGRRKDELRAEDLVKVWLDEEGHDGPLDASLSGRVADDEDMAPELAPRVAPRPSSDIAIHRAIYGARPDVSAIVHAHLPAALALTMVGEAPDPSDLPETSLFLSRLPVVSFEQPGSPALAAAIADALTNGGGSRDIEPPNAVLLERHGAVAVGPDVTTAGDRLELVDLLCRVHRDALLVEAARSVLMPGRRIVGGE